MSKSCENRLEITGPEDDLARFKKQAVSSSFVEDGCRKEVLSFESVYPTPETLNITSRDHTDEYDSYYGDANKVLGYQWVKEAGINSDIELRAYLDEFKPGYRKVADLAKLNIATHGFPDYCRWRVANWGVKDDAYDSSLTISAPDCINYTFSSSKPPALCIANLSTHNPNLQFKLIYEKQGAGTTGYVTYKEGQILCQKFSKCWQGVHPDDMEHWDYDSCGIDFDIYPFVANYGYVSDPDRIVRSVEDCERIISGEDNENEDE